MLEIFTNILKVWWTMLYGFCHKFYKLSGSEKILMMCYVLARLRLVKPGTFFGTQCS